MLQVTHGSHKNIYINQNLIDRIHSKSYIIFADYNLLIKKPKNSTLYPFYNIYSII